ncbi:MAG: PEGA domain-containing protein, partial [Euryarchaeota archaeon]|nr:PEGA domain-containing protein [Euryarchaeota archaeon]
MDRGLFRLLSVLVLCALIGGYVACAVEIEGVIFINSDPEGANIFLKSLPVEGSPEGSLSVEDLIGVTPMQFQYPPGNYMIYLQKFGYVSWWEEIVVDNGQITQVNGGIPVELANQELRYGALHIETNPADADIVLERVIDPSDPQRIENSKVHGKTPLSLESLPPGRYDYTITKEGYETITSKGSTDYAPIEVMAGVVSERSFPLQLIPTTVPIRFNSLPVGAEVYVFPFLSKYEGVDLEALDSDEIFDEIEAEASKFTLGYIGYTPTTFEMPAGKWMYMMKKDSHYPVIGMFTAVVGNPQDINRKLRPFPQFVEVYFEVGGAKPNDGANVAIKHKGKVLGQTPSQNNCSITGIECFGVWVSLPAEMIVDVVFSKEHFKDLPVKVDTSLFKGRPSKWGKLIELERLNYTLTPRADEFSRIDPAGRQTVVAEECGGAFLISVRPEYSPDYVIKDITLNNSSFIDIPPNQINFELRMDKDKGICDIGPIVGNSILSVESERREYTIELVVGPGGSALCDGS